MDTPKKDELRKETDDIVDEIKKLMAPLIYYYGSEYTLIETNLDKVRNHVERLQKIIEELT